MCKDGWGVVLQSEDLDDWLAYLDNPFEPRVEQVSEKAVLRSTSFDFAQSKEDLQGKADLLIKVLNGAVSVHQTAPAELGDAVEFRGGKATLTPFPSTGKAAGKARVRGVASTSGGPRPSPVQQWLHAAVNSGAENDGVLKDALIYFGRADPTDWFDLYKCVECLILRCSRHRPPKGPDEPPPFCKEDFYVWTGAREGAKKLDQTANSHRHAEKKYKVQDPMSFEEAKSFLSALLVRAANEAAGL